MSPTVPRRDGGFGHPCHGGQPPGQPSSAQDSGYHKTAKCRFKASYFNPIFFNSPILDKGILQLCLPVSVRAGRYSAQTPQEYILIYGRSGLIRVGGLCQKVLSAERVLLKDPFLLFQGGRVFPTDIRIAYLVF